MEEHRSNDKSSEWVTDDHAAVALGLVILACLAIIWFTTWLART